MSVDCLDIIENFVLFGMDVLYTSTYQGVNSHHVSLTNAYFDQMTWFCCTTTLTRHVMVLHSTD